MNYILKNVSSHYFLKNISKVKNKMRLREALRDWSYYTCEGGGGWVTYVRFHRQSVVWLAFETSTYLIWFPKPIYLFQRSETVQRSNQLPWYHTEIQQQGNFGSLGFCSRLFFPVCKEGSPIITVIIKTPLTSTLINGIWVLMTVGISVPAFRGIGVQSSI